MAATYTPIASITLGAAAPSVTFSSIPQTYTDLVLVTNTISPSDGSAITLQFNSDTATNYSTTFVYGNGTSAISARTTSSTSIYVGRSFTEFSPGITNIMNYSNSTTNKTVLSRGNAAGSLTILYAGLWRSTSAVTSINLSNQGSVNFSIGSTFNLYGILGANA